MERLRGAADEAQARGQLAIGEPTTTKDAEIDRIQWIEYAATVLEALNASASAAPAADTTDDEAKTRRKR